jgi:hypothetical protein
MRGKLSPREIIFGGFCGKRVKPTLSARLAIDELRLTWRNRLVPYTGIICCQQSHACLVTAACTLHAASIMYLEPRKVNEL